MTNCLHKFYASGKHAALLLLALVGAMFASCGDEAPEYPEFYAVDLGLSADWAWCNQGAKYPEERGTLFEVYENAYLNISGTDVDPAHVELGDGWRIPTEAEMRELVEKCKWRPDTVRNASGKVVYGMTVKGPNGNKIFFPSISEDYRIPSGNYYKTVFGPMPYATGNLDLRLFTFEDEKESAYYYTSYEDFTYSPSLGKETREAFLEDNVHKFYIRPVKKKMAQGVEVDEYNNEVHNVKGVSFKMVYVEGGTFTMGSSSSDSDAKSDEMPAHEVTLDNFLIGETEVTQELWQAVMGNNPSYRRGDLQRPVDYVSWDDCQTFIKKLNRLTGKKFRLPTEAEWEYAARGGRESNGYKYSGSNTVGDVAWFDYRSSVKSKQPNELGIYDMSGGVREWCSDWYGSYSSDAQTNPTGPSSGSDRVLRGGGGAARWAVVWRTAAASFPTGGTTNTACASSSSSYLKKKKKKKKTLALLHIRPQKGIGAYGARSDETK